MPLTAYSTSHPGERDVEQILNRVSTKFGQPITALDFIPDDVRAYLRTDLQCPSCFVKGAEIVRAPRTTGKGTRQSFFRFSTPGHRDHCDFANPEMANSVPENLVSLMECKSNLTRAVRELVCTAIEHQVFSQVSIRDMREWFFNKKVGSLFVVTLDPRFYDWVSALQQNSFLLSGALPHGLPLTDEIASLPQFDWRAEAARRVMHRYPEHGANMTKIFDQRIAMFGDAGSRAAALALRFQGRLVFDPTVLAAEYRMTCSLANFIVHNYAPLKAAKGSSSSASVLAFSALLLFVRGWNVRLAVSDFARIVGRVGGANADLGNVMGLNPFHDYEAWEMLKRMQELNLQVPEHIDIKAERATMEDALRREYGRPTSAT